MRIVIILAFALGMLVGCAHSPKATRPEGVPYPTKLGPQIKAYPLAKVRCLGTMLGGCGPLDNTLRR